MPSFQQRFRFEFSLRQSLSLWNTIITMKYWSDWVHLLHNWPLLAPQKRFLLQSYPHEAFGPWQEQHSKRTTFTIAGTLKLVHKPIIMRHDIQECTFSCAFHLAVLCRKSFFCELRWYNAKNAGKQCSSVQNAVPLIICPLHRSQHWILEIRRLCGGHHVTHLDHCQSYSDLSWTDVATLLALFVTSLLLTSTPLLTFKSEHFLELSLSAASWICAFASTARLEWDLAGCSGNQVKKTRAATARMCAQQYIALQAQNHANSLQKRCNARSWPRYQGMYPVFSKMSPVTAAILTQANWELVLSGSICATVCGSRNRAI